MDVYIEILKYSCFLAQLSDEQGPTGGLQTLDEMCINMCRPRHLHIYIYICMYVYMEN